MKTTTEAFFIRSILTLVEFNPIRPGLFRARRSWGGGGGAHCAPPPQLLKDKFVSNKTLHNNRAS